MMTKLPTVTEPAYFFERHPWNQRWVCLALAVMLVGVDFITGPYILFPVFFVLPVMLMAWNASLRGAIGLAVLLNLARFSFHFLWKVPWSVGVSIVDAVIHCGIMLLLAVVTARFGRQTRTMRERLRVMEGFLPICAFCKDIRDDAGNWQKIEVYVGERSEAQFSHDVCPKCAEKHYGYSLEGNRKA